MGNIRVGQACVVDAFVEIRLEIQIVIKIIITQARPRRPANDDEWPKL